MGTIKVYKPTTPGRRSKASVLSSDDITKNKPERGLTAVLKKKAGRSKGTITVRHRGGGAKRKYRIIDFKMDRFEEEAVVLSIEYDPNRNARIALVQYPDGEKRYIIAPDGLNVDDKIMTSKEKIAVKLANRMPLEHIPVGIGVYNLEIEPGKGAKMVRSAGTLATIRSIEGKYAHIKLPSGEIRMFKKEAMATIGQVSNPAYRLIRWGKAGRMRHRGIRPTVRGKAMNTREHPHGAGEGAQSIGLKHPKTKWGKPALGVKTRKKNKPSDKLIIKRRK